MTVFRCISLFALGLALLLHAMHAYRCSPRGVRQRAYIASEGYLFLRLRDGTFRPVRASAFARVPDSLLWVAR